MAISVFDLFKIGIGPSSSHTVGPMRAAALFVQALREKDLLEQVRRIEVRLYGSLSATGIGHGSDNAVIMGLMGEWPDAIDPSQIGCRIETLRETNTLLLDNRLPIPFVWARDMLLIDENLPFHPNAMTLVAEGESGSCTAIPIIPWAAVLSSTRPRPAAAWWTWIAPNCPMTSPAPWSC